MYPFLDDDATFGRLESLHREIESSRLMAQGLPRWGKLIRNLGARAWWLGGLAMRRPPRRRPIAAHHASEEATASDAA
jgi:hypothetical protein